MKYIQYLFTAVILACLVSSCSNDEPSFGQPVALNATIGQIAAETKSGVSSVSALKDKRISLLALNKESGETEYGVSGRAGTYQISVTGGATAIENSEILLLKQRAEVFASFPATAIEINTSKVPVIPVAIDALVLNPTIAADATRANLDFVSDDRDYMYGVAYDETTKFSASRPFADNGKTGQTAAINQYGPIISLGFKHALAQISIVVKGGTYVGDGVLESVAYTRTMQKIGTTTTMSLVDGELNNLESGIERSYFYNLRNLTIPLKLTSDATSNAVFVSYAIPMASSSSKITLMVDNVAMEVELPADKAWKAGSVYVYTVTVNSTSLSLDAVTVIDWTENQIGNVDIN